MLLDLRHALRQFVQAPGFTAVAVLTLAFGIGLSTTIFNAVNPLLFRSLPFRDPDTLVFLDACNTKQGFTRMNVSYGDFARWRDENQVFSSVGIWNNASFTLGHGDAPERVEGCGVSAGLFATLGLAPTLGRDFTADDDRAGAAPVAMIGDGLWRRQFAGDPKIIGQTILLNGKVHTVVGVMPPDMRFPFNSNLWVPLIFDQPEKEHGKFSYNGVGRLKPGVTREQALADMTAIHERLAKERPKTNAHVGAVVIPFKDVFLDRELRTMGWTMLGAVAFVVAVACANVACLFLTRALARQKEFAVRAALGASRWRLLRQFLVESVIIGLAAGVLGLLFSAWGVDLLLQLVPITIPYWIDFTLDWRVFTFTAGVSLSTSVVFGLAPAWQALRSNVQAGLNEAGRGNSGGLRRQRLRSVFVVSEVALATLLLCGTGLMIRSLLNLQRVDPGFDPDRTAIFYLDSGATPNSTQETRVSFFSTLVERLRALPDVESAAACSSLPLSGSHNGQGFVIEGRPLPAAGQNPVGNLRIVTPGYFSTMKIPLLRGRDFSEADAAKSKQVIIVEAAFARQHFGDSDPIGQHIRWSLSDPSTAMEIVGLVADVKHSGLDRQGRTGFYIPHAQNGRRALGVVVRTKNDSPLGILPAAKNILREINPAVPLYRPATLADMIGETYWMRRFLGRLLVVFAALTLLLAAVGLASTVAYAVTQRTHEIGVRMALGAQPEAVLRLVLGQGLRLVLCGLGVGLIASLGLTRLLSAQLFGIAGPDPVTLGGSALIFSIVALLACWWPARQAARVNPIEALRAE